MLSHQLGFVVPYSDSGNSSQIYSFISSDTYFLSCLTFNGSILNQTVYIFPNRFASMANIGGYFLIHQAPPALFVQIRIF